MRKIVVFWLIVGVSFGLVFGTLFKGYAQTVSEKDKIDSELSKLPEDEAHRKIIEEGYNQTYIQLPVDHEKEINSMRVEIESLREQLREYELMLFPPEPLLNNSKEIMP